MQRQTLARARTLPTLPVHAWLNQLGFPRSYTGKFFLVAFLATALPLLAVAVYVAFYPGWLSARNTFILVMVTAVLGGLLASWAVVGLLKPILEAHQALKAYLDGTSIPTIKMPSNTIDDEAGALVQNLNYALAMFSAHQHQSQRDSPRDFLTGLLNRHAAEERLTLLARSLQGSPFEMCIARLDLYSLKSVNERYGYPVGDQVLRRVARTVTQQLRGTDWVARWGGHELLLVIQSNAEGTAHALKRVQQEIEETIIEIGEYPIEVKLHAKFTPLHGGEPLEAMITQLESAEVLSKHV